MAVQCICSLVTDNTQFIEWTDTGTDDNYGVTENTSTRQLTSNDRNVRIRKQHWPIGM